MRSITLLKFSFVAACALAISISAGCAQLNNPWSDSSALIDADMTTPTTEGYKGSSEFGGPIRRSCEGSEVRYANGSVTHWPLWWEDPFEDKGNREQPPASGNESEADNQFVVTWVDYVGLGYSPARMFLNTIGWPISAVVTPPGTLMESDGRISKGLVWHDHDAKRSDSATREPPDVSAINKAPFVDQPPEEEDTDLAVRIDPPSEGRSESQSSSR